MPPLIEYLLDAGIEPGTDHQIRDLLKTCFTKEEDEVFRRRRYFIEPYPHRWVIRSPDGHLMAHVGVHDKPLQVGTQSLRFGGIAEVCVHPDHRGRGYVKSMLAVVHSWLEAHGFAFAILFGDPQVYESSGYRVVDNIRMSDDPAQPVGPRHTVTAMIRPLTADLDWPDETVFIPGPKF